MRDLSIKTKLVHAGERREPPVGKPVATPIYATSTYTYGSMADMDAVFTGEGGDYIYSRYGNPTVAAVQDVLAAVENGKVSVAYGSGMAALHAALIACEIGPGTTVLASQDIYGATFDLLYKIFGPMGVQTRTADFNDVDSLRANVDEMKPRVLLAETISNPLLKICDVAAAAEIAHRVGARLIIDNTFASPYLARPLELGADFSVHSATKYLGGHADTMGGIVISNEETDEPALVGVMKLVGGVMSVWEAHQILRGMKTLGLRIERQCENARLLAEKLQGNDRIETVYYAGFSPEGARLLPHDLGGALVTIRLKDDTREAAFRFMDALELAVRATSLGDVYTLVSHSASSSHRELSPKRLAELGITEGLVRISVGIEDINDIVFDIENALSK